MKKRVKEKGFTLVELLATIFIISIVLGIGAYFVINTISNSKENSKKLSYENLKTSAQIYIKENPNKIVWASNNDNETYSCISINTLINQGIIKKAKVDNEIKYIKITKDINGNIVSEKIYKEKDKVDECNIHDIEIPTSKEYCDQTLTYNGSSQNLVSKTNEYFNFKSSTGTDAGNYNVIASLSNDEYMWSDGTTEDKKITCKIKKAKPYLVFNTDSVENVEVHKIIKGTLTSNVDGKINLKSSNKDYAIATIDSEDLTKEEIKKGQDKNIFIEPLSERAIETNTIITITLTPAPEYIKNYMTTSITYSLGEIELNNLTVNYNTNGGTKCNPDKKIVTYKNKYNELCTTTKIGYTFKEWNSLPDGTGTKITSSTTVNTKTDHTIHAQWMANKYILTADAQGGIIPQTTGWEIASGAGSATKIVTYDDEYGILPTPKKIGSTFDGWYINVDGSETPVTNSTIVKITEPQTIYAKWKDNKVNIKIHMNGGIWGGSTNPDYSYEGNYVTKNGSTIVRKYNYGQQEIDLLNWDNKNYVNIKKEGYIAKKGEEWNLKSDGTGKSFIDNEAVVSANDLCDASQKSCTAILYVNWVPNTYTLTYNSGNLFYGLENLSTTDTERMKYSISNGTVTVTAKLDDGNGYTTARAYLIGGNTYTLSMETNAPNWGSDVEAFLMLNGSTATYYRANSKNFTFSPSATGYYWLRLDVNVAGKTYKFSNISISSTFKTIKYKTGDMVNLSDTITRDGLTFKGWNTTMNSKTVMSSYQMPGKDSTIYGVWINNKYTVKYDCNGGSGEPSSQTAVYGLPFAVASNTCKKSGYTFDGWYDSTNVSWTGWKGTWTYDNGKYGIANNSLTLKAKWKSNCSESSPTSCNKLYICKSGDPDKFKVAPVWVRIAPHFNNTDEHAVIYSPSVVYSISTHTDTNGNVFHKVYIPTTAESSETKSSFYASWYEKMGNTRIGYIYSGCLRTTKANAAEKNSWCWKECW